MRFAVYSLAILAALATFGCAGGGEVVYTGENEEAAEGAWIKDPEAYGSTRDRSGRREVTRTRSNRVDIPVAEFGAITGSSEFNGAYAVSDYDGRYVAQGFEAGRFEDYTYRRTIAASLDYAGGAEWLFARLSGDGYGGATVHDSLSRRTGEAGLSAYSAQDRPWSGKGSRTPVALHAQEQVSAVRGEAYLEGARNEAGYGGAWGARVRGLHLWKYADRDLVGDGVEVKYTIVYYNTNDENTGPTVIDEPVPLYTRYVPDSATTPREGVTVERIERPGRDLLRWTFPDGVRAGETNRMTYRVTVDLAAEYESGADE